MEYDRIALDKERPIVITMLLTHLSKKRGVADVGDTKRDSAQRCAESGQDVLSVLQGHVGLRSSQR